MPGSYIGGSGLYHADMRITLSYHARQRLWEKGLTRADVRNVLEKRAATHPSQKKRTEKGRALSGERIHVVYTEANAGEFRIVSVVTPDRR
jgi:hypothetical protein